MHPSTNRRANFSLAKKNKIANHFFTLLNFIINYLVLNEKKVNLKLNKEQDLFYSSFILKLYLRETRSLLLINYKLKIIGLFTEKKN